MDRRMVRIWRAGDQLPTQHESASISEWKSGRKYRTLQHIKADTAQLVDIGVVYLGQESDLGRGHGVVVWKE